MRVDASVFVQMYVYMYVYMYVLQPSAGGLGRDVDLGSRV